MQKVKFADAGGDTISLAKWPNGVVLHRFYENIDFDAISSVPMKDDDVIICSYPRSGVHWLCEQMRMIGAGTTEVQGPDKETTMIEFHHKVGIDKLPAPRILNSHFRFELLPVDLLKKRTKVVLLYRNPKDVAVSSYNMHRGFDTIFHYSGQFGNYLKLFQDGNLPWGSYADYLRDWEKVMQQHPELPVHLVTYDELHENPVAELRRLSEFWGKAVDDDFLRAVSEACTIDKQRDRKATFWSSAKTSTENDALNIHYRKNIHYGKGGTGGWKNWFTVAQNEQFDLYWAKAMAGSKIFSFKNM